MTATRAGEPAMDPDDASATGPGAPAEGDRPTDPEPANTALANTAPANTALANTERVAAGQVGPDRADTDHVDTGRVDTGRVDMGRVDTGRVSADRAGDQPDAGLAGRQARIAALRDRLLSPMPNDRVWGWVGPLLITVFAAVFRFYRLSTPHAIIFDETYYVKDAWSILRHGVEWNAVANPAHYASGQNYANNLLLSGNTHIFAACSGTSCGEYVVQPEVGKYLIAAGEWIFGLNPFGYRVASALFGSLAILLMCRIARRLTRSTLLGCVAGLLLSLDGMEFVLSRTGILDIFLMFFVLAAFGALLIDRDAARARLAEAMVTRPGDLAGPELGVRCWRLAAGLLIGLACAVKQDAVWYIPAFIGLAIAWDVGARKAVGLRQPWQGALLRDGKWLPLTLLVTPFFTYVASWANWLITSTGYYRDYASTHGLHVPVISALWSLVKYHQAMVQFGVSLKTPHPYMSQPWGWIVLSRPVAFYYQCYTSVTGAHACPASGYTGPNYSQEVLPLGNPAIWWVSIPAMLFCLGWWLTRRDWRAGAALLCVAAGWLTWLPFVQRTKFDYYSLEFLPFLILCITLCLGLIIGPARAALPRRAIGAAIAGTYVLAVVILFWYFYPILAGQIIPYSSWLSHMWYHGWI